LIYGSGKDSFIYQSAIPAISILEKILSELITYWKNPNADVLELEICSWKINCCKSYLRPDEFIALCNQVAEFTKKRK
jgi:hypothetical protein